MKIFPSEEEFNNLVQQGYSAIPIWTEILADLETPVSCYLKAKEQYENQGPFFLLESVEGGEKLGRYSIIGLNPAGLLKVKAGKSEFQAFWESIAKFSEAGFGSDGNPFDDLEKIIELFKSPGDLLPAMSSGLVGALAFDSVRFNEPVPNLKVSELAPEAIFVLTGDLIVFDNLTRSLLLMTSVYVKEQTEGKFRREEGIERIKDLHEKILKREISESQKKLIPSGVVLNEGRESTQLWTSNFEQKDFEEVVEKAKERIKAGDIFQIVPSRQLRIDDVKDIDPFQIYRLLRNLNPSPYLYMFDFQDFQIIGSSPEVMVKSTPRSVNGEQKALLRPIAGTYRRGADEAEDLRLAESLRNDPKELAEHLMLIDLARNDLGRVAIAGTVEVTDLMIIEKYSHVLHLVSEIQCEVKTEMNSIDLLKSVFPAGTLSGAPKVKAIQIISELETVARGFYGGCVGYFGFDGSVNTAMTIRTMIKKDDSVYLQVGCGVVYDSDPEKEYQETLNKGAASLRVIEQALKNLS